MHRDYSAKGVRFFYVYKSLAHPETNGFVPPITLDERLAHIAEAKRQLRTEIPWLCDTMDNDLKHALGNAPNSEFIVAPNGELVSAERWSNPQQLRSKLAELVGESERVTDPRELDLGTVAKTAKAKQGVVPRLDIPNGMSAIVVKPIERQRSGKTEPFYVKLRAEMAKGQDESKLYLGFFLDPIHKVHWNNLAEPLEFEIETPDGVELTETSGRAPEIEEPADSDPREFLLSVRGQSDEPLKVTVRYFACDDGDRFCKAVTQEYELHMQRDPDGGSRRSNRGRSRMQGRPGGSERAGMNRQQMMQRIRSVHQRIRAALDRDRDGTISADELDRASASLRALTDRDGVIRVLPRRPTP